jgi:hypothetical protein
MSRVHCTRAYTIVRGSVQQRRDVLPEPVVVERDVLAELAERPVRPVHGGVERVPDVADAEEEKRGGEEEGRSEDDMWGLRGSTIL